MIEDQPNRNNLLDTTDCLEAIGVFKGWKNFLFIIIVCCLLLLQVSFWLVNTGYVRAADDTKADSPDVMVEDTGQSEAVEQTAAEPNRLTEAAHQDSNHLAEAQLQQPLQRMQQPQKTRLDFFRKFKHWSRLIRFVNFILVFTAMLYCLTMLFSLKVSMLGRLGGINHISRAFFISLVTLVLLLPWQRFFPGIVAGAMYSPDELLSRYNAVKESGIFATVFYYLRFTGYWLLVFLTLIFSQHRSARWTRATLSRLEVI